MPKTILVISTEYPGYGGSATNSYAIINFLRTQQYNCIGVFIDDKENINVDPDQIGGIYHFKYLPFLYNNKKLLCEYRDLINANLNGPPSIILCKNYIAPICSKILYPKIKNIYFVAGLTNIIRQCIRSPVQSIISLNFIPKQCKEDIKAIECSNLVVANSPLSLQLLLKTYSNYKHKIYPKPIDTTTYISSLLNDNNNDLFPKKYDIIVASSILTRPEKNNLFLIDILNHPDMINYTKLIVGNNNSKFKDIPNSTVCDLLPHNDLMQLMKQSKVLLYPSLYDSNPNTIREAIHHKCLILMSNNIGYYEIFPEISVCKTYDQNEWISKVLYLLENYSHIITDYKINFVMEENIQSLIDKFI